MPGIGTLANVGMILGGSIIGMFLKKGVPERFKTIVFQALGTATFLIGLSGVLSGVLKTNDSGGLDSQYILLLILSLVLGGVLGELLRLDRLFDQVGEKIKRAFSKQAAGTDVGTGFANCTILFCAGAMAIVGAVQDGLAGDPTMLIAKGMMDGIVSVLFTTVYGVGVPLSALAVLVYQGSITLLAFLVKPYLTDAVVLQMSLVGSALGSAEAYAGKHGPIPSLFDGIGMGLGFTVGLTLIGMFRELIGAGTLFGIQVMPSAYEPVNIFIMAPGAFLVLAMLVAVQNRIKRQKSEKTGKPAVPAEETGCMACANKAYCQAVKGKEEAK